MASKLTGIPSDFCIVKFDMSAYAMEDELTIAYLPVGRTSLDVPGTVHRRLTAPEVLRALRASGLSLFVDGES